jgi:hypothetical protein
MTCHSEDGILYPWTVTDDAATLWNTYFSKKFGWRTFAHSKSNSKQKSAYRLTMLIKKNARWLEGSSHSELDDLYENWRTLMVGASAYLEKNGVDEAGNIMNRPVSITMGFWNFLQPDFRHLHVMTYTSLGIDPDGALAADEQRRKDKSAILKDFKEEVMAFIKDAAYLSGSDKHSNQKLNQALTIARQAMEQAREDLQFQEN